MRANKHQTGVNKNSIGAVPAQERRVPWHAQPRVQERHKSRDTKRRKQLVMTYSNWKVKRDGRTREGLDELNVLSSRTQQLPRLAHPEDPGQRHVVVFID